MNEIEYLNFLKLMLPEAVLTVVAFGVILLDFIGLRGHPVRLRMTLLGLFAAVGCAAAVVIMLQFQPANLRLDSMMEITSLIQHVKVTLLLLTLAVVLMACDTDFTPHAGEYFALLLFATIGFMLLVSATHLLMIFVALELASLSLYLLTAFDKRNPRASEAGLKYFLFGSIAAACTLFGLSLVYGLTGSLDLRHMEMSGLVRSGLHPLLLVALVLVLAGFAFKIAVVPFHLWAPDAYQGAPAPSAALLAAGSKVASFFVLARLVNEGFRAAAGSANWNGLVAGWLPILALLAALSMVLGNLAAIAQNNVRRLLAYSAIAHGGYALIAVLTNRTDALMYYMITYGCTIIGAFGVVAIVERATGGSDLDSFNGLAHRSPALAASLMVFMLSLAGIPPLAGFFGKFYVFLSALRGQGAGEQYHFGLLYLVILGIAMSAVSLYYYLIVLKRAYAADPPENAPPISFNQTTLIIIALALLVILLGCFPGELLRLFRPVF